MASLKFLILLVACALPFSARCQQTTEIAIEASSEATTVGLTDPATSEPVTRRVTTEHSSTQQASITTTAASTTTALTASPTSEVSSLHVRCEAALLQWSPWTTKAENIVSNDCGVRRRNRRFPKAIGEDFERQCQEGTELEMTQYKEFCNVLSRNENVEVIQYYFVNAVFGHSAHIVQNEVSFPNFGGLLSRRKRFIDFDNILVNRGVNGICPEDKTKRPVDFLIMLDKSGSMLLKHFRLLLRSMKFLVANGIPNVTLDTTRIAMVTFANNPTVEFTFDRCADRDCVKEQIYNADFNGGLTRLAVALDKVDEVFDVKYGMRACSRRVVLLVTDGSSAEYDNGNPEEAAARLRESKDVEIFAVGISKLINEIQLQGIVSYPVLTHLYYMPDVRQTRRVFKKIKQAMNTDL